MADKTVVKYQPVLKEFYKNSLVSELKSELELKNVHEVPVLQKIVVSAGLGRAKDDKKVMAVAENTLAKITGQKPLAAYAKKSIASFKLREGSQVGWKVTLRDGRMYEFAQRLINVVLPRQRDFHGVPVAAFDRSGNYHIGFADQSVFPELSFEETSTSHGLQVSFVMKTGSQEHSKALLERLGLPFDKKGREGGGEEANSG